MKARTSESDRSGCVALRFGDQMQCARCGLIYDIDDPDPPDCLSRKEVSHRRGREALENIKKELARP